MLSRRASAKKRSYAGVPKGHGKMDPLLGLILGGIVAFLAWAGYDGSNALNAVSIHQIISGDGE
jgi:hypothetical protein